MIPDAFFSQALDAHPSDSAARLLYAAWLRARGSSTAAAGAEWCARYDRWPLTPYRASDEGIWMHDEYGWVRPMACDLPLAVYERLPGGAKVFSGGWETSRSYPTRAAAEAALAEGLAKARASVGATPS